MRRTFKLPAYLRRGHRGLGSDLGGDEAQHGGVGDGLGGEAEGVVGRDAAGQAGAQGQRRL